MSYVDLHLHLLPGVDDGAPDLETAVRHARRMVAEGVTEATVTPHIGHPEWYVDPRQVERRTRRLADVLRGERIALRLRPGGELHPARAAGATADELAAVSHGPAGSRWLLLEVPFAGVDPAFLETCRALRRRGYGLVIAHPERAAGLLLGGLDRLRPEIEAGAVLQVNVCSLLGNNGPEARRAGERLVRSGLAYLLASDGHPGTREHTLRLGFDLALRAGASSLQAWRLTQANPRFLLEHGIPPAPRTAPAPAEAPVAFRDGRTRRATERVLEAARRR